MRCILIFLSVLSGFNGTKSLDLAQPCYPSACKLPACKCSTTDSESSIPISKIPQIVMLTFDDAVTAITYPYFEKVLFGRKNPDGCPIGVTHFLCHEYTDYSKVQDLWRRGHEIALHSVTHTGNDYWRNLNVTTLKSEFDDMRTIITHFAGVPKSHMVGMRVPFLELSGNTSFQGLRELGLIYDSSMPTIRYTEPALWPYTLEYASHQDCMIEPCPSASFPNVWEVPMVSWKDEKDVSCSFVDACVNIPKQAEPLSKWFIRQFQRHYNGSRAPFPVFMHAAWFTRSPEYFKAYQIFIDHLQSLPDVYLVTVANAIDWIKNPKPINVKNPFGKCEVRIPSTKCVPRSCRLKTTDGQERWMMSCVSVCPDNYPWLYNPLGV